MSKLNDIIDKANLIDKSVTNLEKLQRFYPKLDREINDCYESLRKLREEFNKITASELTSDDWFGIKTK